MFQVYPAIDLRHGQVVRLQEGNPSRQTVFDHDPVAVARRWAESGARWLHLVNLDGAFDEAGQAAIEFDALLRMLCQVGPRIQFGGGVRSLARIETALQVGVSRVVLGTVAVEQPQLVREAVSHFGAQVLAVGVDARQGRVHTRGWQADGGLTAIELGKQMKAYGVELLVHTEIERDGLLTGVNAQASAELAQACNLSVIASGGVASLDDIRRTQAKESQGIVGVIVGRALYQGRVSLQQALAIGCPPSTPREEQAC
jgi:phosphoribosylformimino-5-aminoimidazole carboxamide ribotide isomerase